GSFRRLRNNAYKTRANSVERSKGDRFFPISQPLGSRRDHPHLKASLCRGADKFTNNCRKRPTRKSPKHAADFETAVPRRMVVVKPAQWVTIN
ncbi:hypothetical protein, partial [Ensifer aridi]|uniref:hypothetical protein n=1 Tax=Ensifer aridi TaxID=1708715 RepID=UPI001AECBCFC